MILIIQIISQTAVDNLYLQPFCSFQDADYHLHILEFGSHFGVIGSFLKGPRAELKLKNKEQSQE